MASNTLELTECSVMCVSLTAVLGRAQCAEGDKCGHYCTSPVLVFVVPALPTYLAVT